MSKKQEYLTESYYYILLCLYKGLNYGYGIMQEAIKLLNNIVKIGSGTMYTAVSKMIKKDSDTANEEDDRRRTYEITLDGRNILLQEIERLKEIFEDLGWKYINLTYNGWNYFRKNITRTTMQVNMKYIYIDYSSCRSMLSIRCKLGKVIFVISIIIALLYTFLAIRNTDIIIGIEIVLFLGLFIWIKRGLEKMEEK